MVTRITGMASGMDVDSMVKKLMKAESAPLTKMNQQKQLMEWKRESYRDTSSKLVTFLQDKISALSTAASLNAQVATVSGNTSAVTASASSTASGIMEVTVNSLASSSRATTKSTPTDSWSSTPADTKLSAIDPSLSGTVRIGNSDISIGSDETVATFIQKINSDKNAGVTAIYDATNGISFTSKKTGADNSLASVASPSTAFGIDSKVASAFKLDFTPGTNAEATINGLKVTQASNTFDVNGVTLTLNSKTPAGESTRISVNKDTDKIVSAVQDFVNAYNDILSSLNSKVGEERYKKYTPLSTEERAAMSDEEAKLWNDKAKSGMLKNDSILQDTIASMRTAIIQGVDIGRKDADGNNKPLTMVELGITTGNYQTKGKLSLDTDKLKAALEKDPEIVSTFLGKNYTNSFSDTNYTTSDGVLAKMRKISTTALKRMADTAGTSTSSKDITASFMGNSVMGEQLTSLDRRISDFTSKLNTIETNYYKKFAAMETAISKYNTTSSSLTGM
ncbi:flagellar cap protein FliD [Saccharibacillus sp. O23]|uniref:flagellar filament capping protein FliD n=1 Tax=Saccharibacillus sp. O23 TaxID=2009338 RepID=UPI000B4E010B|nr:flagellar filament capping protein FliD [Saccharibacillus sp. O23]OWR27598.1 flagellar cap protein FliD [Saccharibacillus sp. O23]